MHRPEPQDFGINSHDIEWAKKVDRRVPQTAFVVSAVGWAIYALIHVIPSHIDLQHLFALAFHADLANLFALAVFSGSLFVGLMIVTFTTIVGAPCGLMLLLLVPRYRQVQRYQKAVELFRAWWLRTQKEFWMSLSGKQFEAELAGVFRKAGFRAELTAASGDKGVDIWLYTERGKEIVQCKAHSGPIGPAVARELYGTLQHFGAPAAILASTSGFTKGVRAFARNKPIVLMDLSDIIALQERNSGL
jgi:Holliday junction resolvase